MRFFRSDVERILKIVGMGAVLMTLLLPLQWGYHQRQRARTWRETACAYRLREVSRRTEIALAPRPGEGSCAVLHRLGLDVEPGR